MLRAGWTACVSYSTWLCTETREEEGLQRWASGSDLNRRSQTYAGANRSSDSSCGAPGYCSPPATEVVSLRRS